ADTLSRTFHQPFATVASEEAIHQARIAIEILRAYLKTLSVPATVQTSLEAAEAGYRLAAYQSLLLNIGTSYDEVRLTRTARGGPPGAPADPQDARQALADRLGIDLDPPR